MVLLRGGRVSFVPSGSTYLCCVLPRKEDPVSVLLHESLIHGLDLVGVGPGEGSSHLAVSRPLLDNSLSEGLSGHLPVYFHQVCETLFDDLLVRKQGETVGIVFPGVGGQDYGTVGGVGRVVGGAAWQVRDTSTPVFW